jgi:hypothetical protein
MDNSLLSFSIILIVAIISLTLSMITYFAYLRLKNAKLLFVFLAFLLFFIKGVYVSSAILYDFVGHEHLELHSSLFDLLIVAMLFIPFLVPFLKNKSRRAQESE